VILIILDKEIEMLERENLVYFVFAIAFFMLQLSIAAIGVNIYDRIKDKRWYWDLFLMSILILIFSLIEILIYFLGGYYK
jgi:heme O synthase-like polyprenyltransferase